MAMLKAATRQELVARFPLPASSLIVVLHLSDERTIQLQARDSDMLMLPSGNINMAVERLCEILDHFMQAHALWFKENPPPCQPPKPSP